MRKVALPHTKHSIAAIFLTGALAAVAFAGSAALVEHERVRTPQEAAALFPLSPTIAPGVIAAKAAILYDPADGRILFEKNAAQPLPLASLTKLMTAEILLTALSPDTPVVVTADALKMSADQADAQFRQGDVLPLRDILEFGLVASSNVAMQAAAETLGRGYIARMNDVAANLGLAQTHFTNPTGLDVSTSTPGATASAYDVARLAALFYTQYPSYFSLTRQGSIAVAAGKRTLSATATALPLQTIPGFIGAKTGYTDLAGGNLVAVFDVDIDHPIVAVVLGSSENGRFDDIRTLMQAIQHL